MALGILGIIFIVLGVMGSLGIIFLYLSKNAKAQDFCLYSLGVLGLFISFLNTTGLPDNYIAHRIMTGALGFLCIVAVIIKIKTPKQQIVSKLLVTLSVVLGLGFMYFG